MIFWPFIFVLSYDDHHIIVKQKRPNIYKFLKKQGVHYLFCSISRTCLESSILVSVDQASRRILLGTMIVTPSKNRYSLKCLVKAFVGKVSLYRKSFIQRFRLKSDGADDAKPEAKKTLRKENTETFAFFRVEKSNIKS